VKRFFRLIPIKRIPFFSATWPLLGAEGWLPSKAIDQNRISPQNLGESYRERRDRKVCAWKTAGVVAECSRINIGGREIFAAVPPGRDAHPVRVFATFTEDLQKLADWLVTCGIATVAMESTDVY
jgi:hypothetical protein